MLALGGLWPWGALLTVGFKGNACVYGAQLGSPNLSAGQEQRCRCKEQICEQGGRWDKTERLGSLRTVMCKQIAGGNLLDSAASPAQCSAWPRWLGWGWVQRGYSYTLADLSLYSRELTHHCNTNIPQLKKERKKELSLQLQYRWPPDASTFGTYLGFPGRPHLFPGSLTDRLCFKALTELAMT